MDETWRIYADILNSLDMRLSKLSPHLAGKALSESMKILDSKGIRYSVGRKGIEFRGGGEPSQVYDSIIEYARVFEEEYGTENAWKPIRAVIIGSIKSMRQRIRELSIEVPVARYDMTHTIYGNLVQMSSQNFRKTKWADSTITINNKRLVFEGIEFSIPFSAISTVGREIYMVYTGAINKGIIRAIDFRLNTPWMSCAVVVGKKDPMEDFIRVLRVMRNEWRTLSALEARVIVALFRGAAMADIPRLCHCDGDSSKNAIKRLKELGAMEFSGRLTPYGIICAEAQIGKNMR